MLNQMAMKFFENSKILPFYGINSESNLCQKNENGNELIFTENSSVYHAVCGYKGEFSRANRDFTLVTNQILAGGRL